MLHLLKVLANFSWKCNVISCWWLQGSVQEQEKSLDNCDIFSQSAIQLMFFQGDVIQLPNERLG